MENGLSLTTITLLLPVVTSLSLCKPGRLAGLVLADLVISVLAAPIAKGLAFLWYVNHSAKRYTETSSLFYYPFKVGDTSEAL